MTEQETIREYYKLESYKSIANRTGISLRRVQRTLTGTPVEQDLNFLVNFMQWELKNSKTKPTPPKVEKGGRPRKTG
jgi:hypothetical protein